MTATVVLAPAALSPIKEVKVLVVVKWQVVQLFYHARATLAVIQLRQEP
jgi:hypothetical protein